MNWPASVTSDSRSQATASPSRSDSAAPDLDIRSVERGIDVDEGGFLWRGQLRLWDNEILMGWYAADDQAVRSNGTLYFVIHQHGQHMNGRWVGLSHDGVLQTGRAAIARAEQAAIQILEDQGHDRATSHL